MDHMVPHMLYQNHPKPFHTTPNHLILRGSKIACNRKHDYHDSCTLCKGQCPVPMCSDFITGQVIREPPFCDSLCFLWCMAQRSLHAVTQVYYGSYVQLCLGNHTTLAMQRFLGQFMVPRPLLHLVALK
jgi:hypothetical protein